MKGGKCPAQGCEEVRTPKEVRPNTVLVHQQSNKRHVKESLLDCRVRICGPLANRPAQEPQEETYAERGAFIDLIRNLLAILVKKQVYDQRRLRLTVQDKDPPGEEEEEKKKIKEEPQEPVHEDGDSFLDWED
jgi:hypothetical protein